MRITRAYTITQEVKRILDTKQNKSDYICRAVRKMHIQEQEFDLRDIPTRQLMAALQARDDCVKHVKIILWDQLEASS
jgi:hypothetical protein